MLLSISAESKIHVGTRIRSIIAIAIVVAGQGLWFGLSLSSLEANGAVREYQKNLSDHYEIGLGTVPYSPSPGIVQFCSLR